MNERISVIIPAYNVEPYLEKCVHSVLNQSFSNLEIILVDDGSTDNTGALCDSLKAVDSRVKVIHQKNMGLSAARNAGLDVATGDWIAFIDSDDWVEKDMYQCLYEAAISYDADIASCRSRNCVLGNNPPEVIDSGKVIIFSPEEMIRGLLDQRYVRFEVWNKLWKRSLIADVRFIVGQVSEDVFFDRVLFLKANKMVHIERTLHNYLIQRPGNTLSSYKPARLCVFHEFDSLIKDLEGLGYSEAKEIINCVATAFAVTIYGQAKKTKQDGETKQKLRALFKKYYSASKGSKFRSKRGDLGMKLFYVSPTLFYLLWDRYGKSM